MTISLNYRFLLSIGATLMLATVLLSVLLMQVLGHHAELVPLWGQQSIATDLISFSLAFSFLLSYIATKLTRKALQKKKVLPLHWHLKSQTLIDRLPDHILHRAFMLSLAGVVIASLTLLLFRLQHVKYVPYQEYIWLFVVYASSLACAIIIMAFYRALGDGIAMRRKLKQKNASTL
jgi:MFS family permease